MADGEELGAEHIVIYDSVMNERSTLGPPKSAHNLEIFLF